jgi:hypothetical protein
MLNGPQFTNIGSQSIHSGDFGESFIAYLLSKKGIAVVRARTIGFDLLAIDNTGRLLPKKRIVGISVKTRVSRSHKKYVPTIPIGSVEIKKSMKIWNIQAFIGIVVGSMGNRIDAFVFPFNDIPNLRGNSRRNDVVAVSELFKNSTGNVEKLF